MEQSRSTADRIRPILKAMERSIESARRNRLHDPSMPSGNHATEQPLDQNPDAGVAPLEGTRQKARPKRPSITPRYDEPEYRAEAV